MAQVTISGLLDMSYHSIGGNGTDVTTKIQSISSSVGSATSAINVNAVEDLGGGLKGQAFVAIDPRAWANDAGLATGVLGRHETYVGVSGGFGNLRLGAVNTASLSAMGAGGPFGTATGGAFTNIELASGGAVRFNRSLRYDTPNFGGFTASLNYAPGNDDATSAAAPAITALNTTTQQVTDLGLYYNNGPLSIAVSNLQRSAFANGSMPKSTFTSVGANYALGATKFFVGMGKGDKSSVEVTASGTTTGTTGGQDTDLTRVGVTHNMGAITLLAQYTQTEIGTAAKRTATGLRADYALSKRTVAYAGYEAYDTGATTGNKINTTHVGIRHTF